MSDLRDLYQQVILDHNKSPRNFYKLADANRAAEGFNPLCGDHIHVYLVVEKDMIKDVSFEGSGCAISKASASLMSTVLKGKSLAEARGLFKEFQSLVTSDIEDAISADHLGKLTVFSGVREFPVRVKCATLAWHTLNAALENKDNMVTTE